MMTSGIFSQYRINNLATGKLSVTGKKCAQNTDKLPQAGSFIVKHDLRLFTMDTSDKSIKASSQVSHRGGSIAAHSPIGQLIRLY